MRKNRVGSHLGLPRCEPTRLGPRRLPLACRFVATSALLVASGCGARHTAVGPASGFPASPASPGSAPLVVWNARWFPVVDDAEPRVSEMDVDGSARVIERGLRLVEHPDGRLERAADLLP